MHAAAMAQGALVAAVPSNILSNRPAHVTCMCYCRINNLHHLCTDSTQHHNLVSNNSDGHSYTAQLVQPWLCDADAVDA